jgi:uncharacterized phiE125 gp8 family phage protein
VAAPQRIVQAASDPVSVAEARLQCRLTDDDTTVEDGLIATWIAAATEHAQAFTNRSFVTQGWRVTMAGFPSCIELERGIVQRIDSLNYRDMAGVPHTVAWEDPVDGIQRSSDGTLIADLTEEVAMIVPAFGCVWPIAIPEPGAVAVSYTAGYGEVGDVPQGLKSWILLRVARMYVKREEPEAGAAPASHLDGMLDPYVVARA